MSDIENDANEDFIPTAGNLPPAGGATGGKFKPGVYNMRATEAGMGLTSGEKEQVAVVLVFVDGPYKDQGINYYGYFSEKTADRTIRDLRTLGWQSDDLRDLSTVRGTAPVTIIDDTYEGKTTSKVDRIGAPGLAIKTLMPEDQLSAFALRMKSLAARIPAAGGANTTVDKKPVGW